MSGPLQTACATHGVTLSAEQLSALAPFEGIFTGKILAALIAAIKQGLITAASNPDAMIAVLASLGIVVPPMLVPFIPMLCAMLLKVLQPTPVPTT